MTKYDEIMRQITLLRKRAEKERQKEVSAVIAHIKEKMNRFGITVDQLRAKGPGRPRGQRKGQAKYRDPATGKTWSGRGRMPHWLKAAETAGRKREDFVLR